MKNNLLLSQRKSRETLISIGFIIEVMLFILTGFFLAYKSLFVIMFFAVSIWIAFIVGKLIENNAVENYKEDLQKRYGRVIKK